MTAERLLLAVVVLALIVVCALVFLAGQDVDVRESECVSRGGRYVKVLKSTLCVTAGGEILE